MSNPGGGNVWNDPDSRDGARQVHQITNPVRANPNAVMNQTNTHVNQWRDPDKIGDARSVATLEPHTPHAPQAVKTVVHGQTPTVTQDEEVDALKKQIKSLGLEGTDQSRQIMRQMAQAEYNRKDGPRPAVRGALARWGIGSPKE